MGNAAKTSTISHQAERLQQAGCDPGCVPPWRAVERRRGETGSPASPKAATTAASIWMNSPQLSRKLQGLKEDPLCGKGRCWLDAAERPRGLPQLGAASAPQPPLPGDPQESEGKDSGQRASLRKWHEGMELSPGKIPVSPPNPRLPRAWSQREKRLGEEGLPPPPSAFPAAASCFSVACLSATCFSGASSPGGPAAC